MNLQEDIQRIKKVMNINESPNKNLIKLIYEKGLMSAAKFAGGYDNLVKLLGDYEIPKELLIKDIKDFIDKLHYTTFTISEFYQEPIPYKEDKHEYHEIIDLDSKGVTIDVWHGFDNQTQKGEYHLPYEKLTYKTIVDIFEMINDVDVSNVSD